MCRKFLAFTLIIIYLFCGSGSGMGGKVIGKPTPPTDIKIKFEKSQYTKEDDIKLVI